ncbi:TraR/DksA family transcriptional regulator [Pseudoduganella sp. DS3]|uniref:TraR/DksA family transcriptional regulator n=2 Tax=Pseudoduganella guangdongensis TaxID=2692179 RepID=A0A6N9HG52_9BURK|nr:TraR/DksA family transcriptional regulator [Pseudoduganella guangdongensis]
MQAALEQRKLTLLQQLAGRMDGELARVPAVEEIETSPADSASNRTLNQLELEADEHKQAQLSSVRHALAKIEDGSYGLCDNCGNEIPFSRLNARPEAPLCIACQTRLEKATAALR